MKNILLAMVCVLFCARPAQAAQTWVKSDAITNIYSYTICSSADGTNLAAASYADSNVNHPGAIYLSTNSGVNWTQSSAPSNYWNGIAGSTNGNRLAAVVSGGGIWGSTNGGATWTNLNAPTGIWYAVATSASGGSNGVIVAVAGGSDRFIYVSTNSGTTWTNTSAPTNQYWYAVASSADGARLIAVSNSNTNGGAGAIYTSTNAGSTWRSNNVAGIYWDGVASSADGLKLIAIAPNTIYISHDGGVTWYLASNQGGFWDSVASSADGSRLVVGTYPAVYTSSDSGATWTSNSLPAFDWRTLASSYDGNKLVASAGMSGIYTLQTTPTLNYGVTTTNVTLAWPAPSTGFGLEQNTNLATATWVTVANVPALTNWQFQVLLSRTNGNHFFRLKGP